jgi:LPS-assembly lipoprotein
MSWFKPSAALAACFLLAGCGFQPLYGEGGRSDPLTAQLASIQVMQITEHYGQVMTNDLHDGLNPRALSIAPVYKLEVALTDRSYQFATRADGTPSRSALSITASWTLRRIGDNQIVTHGLIKSSAGYDVLNNDYANVVSGNNGELRAVRDLSDQIQISIATYLQSQQKT